MSLHRNHASPAQSPAKKQTIPAYTAEPLPVSHINFKQHLQSFFTGLGDKTPFLHTMPFNAFRTLIFHGLRFITTQTAYPDALPDVLKPHFSKNIPLLYSTLPPDWIDRPTLFIFNQPSHPSQTAFTMYCRIMDAIVKECDNFRLLVNAVPLANPRRAEMLLNDQPCPFHLVRSESPDGKVAPVPNNVVIIPLDIFDALFQNELAEQDERTEDNYKEVLFHFIPYTFSQTFFLSSFFGVHIITSKTTMLWSLAELIRPPPDYANASPLYNSTGISLHFFHLSHLTLCLLPQIHLMQ